MTGITLKIAWIKAHRERFGSSLVTAKNRVEAGWRPDDPDAGGEPAPIPMILFCPECSLQHIDKPLSCSLGVGCDETGVCFAGAQGRPDQCSRWVNPPHRSHLCAGCGHIWRPADVPTTGVAEITTQGKADHQPPVRKRSGRCIGGCDGPVDMEP